MFDTSWGELALLMGLGFAIIGKKDLPGAARFAGTQVGRMVGLLQGARVRADQFTQNNELKQLHNELKSGLRELDAVKAEIAIATSTRGGMMGGQRRRVLSQGAAAATTGGGANKQQQIPPPIPTTNSTKTTTMPSITSAMAQSHNHQNEIDTTKRFPAEAVAAAATTTSSSTTQQIPSLFYSSSSSPPSPSLLEGEADTEHAPLKKELLAPSVQSVAAVAEEEWEKQGMLFRSRAERGVGLGLQQEQELEGTTTKTTGSTLLANLFQQTLIFDHYDRVRIEQDEALQSRTDAIIEKARKNKNNDDTNNAV